ncbi:hypothetical protein ACPCHT_38665 [Nucisporomicrobium flavum]|uniref:hypothetical protein n=1 Tax=Nucisporomicrobium flavum TaxID=2785915 RepID=UPI003C2FBF32
MLLAIAAFVVVGLHLPSFAGAMRDHPAAVQYLSNPTAFWLVRFMDLGIVEFDHLCESDSAVTRNPVIADSTTANHAGG